MIVSHALELGFDPFEIPLAIAALAGHYLGLSSELPVSLSCHFSSLHQGIHRLGCRRVDPIGHLDLQRSFEENLGFIRALLFQEKGCVSQNHTTIERCQHDGLAMGKVGLCIQLRLVLLLLGVPAPKVSCMGVQSCLGREPGSPFLPEEDSS